MEAIRMRRIDELKPHKLQVHWPKLGELGDEASWDDFLASINEQGIQVPVSILPTGEVLDGHQRINAARELGLDEVPCVVKENAGGIIEQAKLIIGFNKNRRHLSTHMLHTMAWRTLEAAYAEAKAERAGSEQAGGPDRAHRLPDQLKGAKRAEVIAATGITDKQLKNAARAAGDQPDRIREAWEAGELKTDPAHQIRAVPPLAEAIEDGSVTIEEAKTINQLRRLREAVQKGAISPLDAVELAKRADLKRAIKADAIKVEALAKKVKAETAKEMKPFFDHLRMEALGRALETINKTPTDILLEALTHNPQAVTRAAGILTHVVQEHRQRQNEDDRTITVN